MAAKIETVSSDSMLKKSLGGKPVVGSNPKWVTLVRNGLPYQTIETANQYWQLEGGIIHRLVGLSARTIVRRKTEPKPLTSEQSERVFRLCKMMAVATAVLESRQVAVSWAMTPNVALDNSCPIDLLDTGIGFQQVLDVLNRIEFGVYS